MRGDQVTLRSVNDLPVDHSRLGRRVGFAPSQLPICSFSAHDQQALCDISFTNLAVHIRDALPRRFSDLAVFDARLYIRVRRIDEPA